MQTTAAYRTLQPATIRRRAHSLRRTRGSLRLSLLSQGARFRAPPAAPLPAARLPLRANALRAGGRGTAGKQRARPEAVGAPQLPPESSQRRSCAGRGGQVHRFAARIRSAHSGCTGQSRPAPLMHRSRSGRAGRGGTTATRVMLLLADIQARSRGGSRQPTVGSRSSRSST